MQCEAPCNFIEKRLQHRCFPVNIAKFLRTAFFVKHLRRLFLDFGQGMTNLFLPILDLRQKIIKASVN